MNSLVMFKCKFNKRKAKKMGLESLREYSGTNIIMGRKALFFLSLLNTQIGPNLRVLMSVIRLILRFETLIKREANLTIKWAQPNKGPKRLLRLIGPNTLGP